MQIDLETYLAAVTEPGWNGLRDLESRARAGNERSSRDRHELARAAEAVLAMPAGKLLIEHMVRSTIMQPHLPAQVAAQHPTTADQCVPYVAYREGQNSVVIELLQLIAEARQAEQP